MLIENFISRLFPQANRKRVTRRRRRTRRTDRTRTTSAQMTEMLEQRALLAATATLSITPSATPSEADANVPFSVTLTGTGVLANDVTVTATANAGTATGGGVDYTDYTELLTFSAGTDLDASGGSVSLNRNVALANDQFLEIDEGFTVDLTGMGFGAPDNITLGGSSFAATINDNESATLAIEAASTPTEQGGVQNTGVVTLTITGTGTGGGFQLGNGIALTADVTDAGTGTATNGTDYAAIGTQTVTFNLNAATGATQSASLTPVNDQFLETNETVNLTLGNLGAGGTDTTLGNTANTTTIDDDEAATLAVAATSGVTEQGGAQTVGVVTLTITGTGTGGLQLGNGITLTADLTDAGTGSGTSGTDYNAFGTQTVTFNSNAATGATQSATLTTLNEQDLEANETVNLSLGNLGAASTDTSLGNSASAVTIDDDESATLAIAATSGVTEQGGAQSVGVSR